MALEIIAERQELETTDLSQVNEEVQVQDGREKSSSDHRKYVMEWYDPLVGGSVLFVGAAAIYFTGKAIKSTVKYFFSN